MHGHQAVPRSAYSQMAGPTGQRNAFINQQQGVLGRPTQAMHGQARQGNSAPNSRRIPYSHNDQPARSTNTVPPHGRLQQHQRQQPHPQTNAARQVVHKPVNANAPPRVPSSPRPNRNPAQAPVRAASGSPLVGRSHPSSSTTTSRQQSVDSTDNVKTTRSDSQEDPYDNKKLILDFGGESCVDDEVKSPDVSTTSVQVTSPQATFFVELPGMNSPEFRDKGDLMESAVMLHKATEKDKAKERHLFLFEHAMIVSKFKGKKYHVKGVIELNAKVEIKDYEWVTLGSEETTPKEGGAFAFYDSSGKLMHAFCETSKENRNAKQKLMKAVSQRLAILRGDDPDVTVDMAAEATAFLLNLHPSTGMMKSLDSLQPTKAEVRAVAEESGVYDNMTGAGFDEDDFKQVQLENIELQLRVEQLMSELSAAQKSNTDMIAHTSRMQTHIRKQMLEIAALQKTVSMLRNQPK